MKGCYRVNYLKSGLPQTTFVVADGGNQASDFVGVRDGSAQVSAVAYPVEVVGVDPAHEVLVPPPVNIAPPDPAAQLSQDELAKLRALLASSDAPAKPAPKSTEVIP